jgi:hypothetical protein
MYVPHGFVAELGSKLRPAGIEHGLRQAGFGKSTGIDITDADEPVLPHDPCRQPMQEVFATICDLGVDGSNARLAPGTLGDGERLLVPAVEPRGLDLLARREGRQRFEAQVDTDLPRPMVAILRNLDLQVEIPAAAGVLSEVAATKPALEWPAEPEPVSVLEEDHLITVPVDRARRLEGDPAQGLLASPSWPFVTGITRDRKLLADRLHRIRVQTEELTAAESKLDQIESGRPALIVPARGFLYLAAVVPHPVHRPSLSLKVPTGSRILDPIPVGQHHGYMVIDTRYENKTDAKHPAGIFTPDSPSVYDAETHASCDRRTHSRRRERRDFRVGALR